MDKNKNLILIKCSKTKKEFYTKKNGNNTNNCFQPRPTCNSNNGKNLTRNVPLYNYQSQSCSSESDCNRGQQCFQGYCRQSCIKRGDCHTGQHCSNERYCVQNCKGGDCPSGQHCDTSSDSSSFGECVDDPYNTEVKGTLSITLPNNPEMKTTFLTDMENPQVCSNGRVYLNQNDLECQYMLKNSDCGDDGKFATSFSLIPNNYNSLNSNFSNNCVNTDHGAAGAGGEELDKVLKKMDGCQVTSGDAVISCPKPSSLTFLKK